MTYCLFLDDEREPNRRAMVYRKSEIVICRCYHDAVNVVKERGFPIEVCFDHDLGIYEGNGHDFAKWLIDYLLDNNMKFPYGFVYSVHSMNPVGKRNIIHTMDNAIEEIGEEE